MRRYWFGLVLVLGCDPGRAVRRVQAAEEVADGGGLPAADRAPIVRGVLDRARDPAVVAIDVAGEALCSGVLVSPRVVVTARHCVRVAAPFTCPAAGEQLGTPRAPEDLVVVVGETLASGRRAAYAVEVLEPARERFCGADLAVLVLSDDVPMVKPMPVRARGPAVGDTLRTVGFNLVPGRPPTKVLREHVLVGSVSDGELGVVEATCLGGAGGAAIDEDTGELVGLVTRDGPCDEARNVYTRVDPLAVLLEEGFTRASEIAVEEAVAAGAATATAKPVKRGTKARPPTDLGGPCEAAGDCAAGLCITDETEGGLERRYCSVGCGAGDRCPTHFHCEAVTGLPPGERVCIDAR